MIRFAATLLVGIHLASAAWAAGGGPFDCVRTQLWYQLIEGSPRAPISPMNISRKAGIAPGHATRISDFAQRNEIFIAIRFTNPAALRHHGLRNASPKPANIPFKTATSGPQAGLVVAPAPQHFRDQTEFLSALDTWKKNASRWKSEFTSHGFYLDENGVVRNAEGGSYFADYDLFGVYDLHGKPLPYGKNYQPTPEDLANLNALNNFVDPLKRMFRHGAHLDWDHLPTNTQADVIVFKPDGTVESMNVSKVKDCVNRDGAHCLNGGCKRVHNFVSPTPLSP